MAAPVNRRVVLARVPDGVPVPGDFRLTEGEAALGKPAGEPGALGIELGVGQGVDLALGVLVHQGQDVAAAGAQVAPATGLEGIGLAVAVVIEARDDVVDGKGLEVALVVGKGAHVLPSRGLCLL